MNTAYRTRREPTPQEHALMANALRIQGRWNDAVAILEQHWHSFHEEIKPFAGMTLILGLERAERTADALRIASEVEGIAPDDLRYFVAYAQVRLIGNSNANERRRALENMLAAADTRERRIAALTRLIELPGDQRNAHALALLELQPTNRAAYDVLEATARPRPAAVYVAMGESAHRRNEHRTAISLLSEVPQGPGWRRATYFRAFSLERTNRYADAIGLFEALALSGNEFADLSVQRIAAIAGRAERTRAIAALRRVVNERKGRIQSRAMFALSRLTEGAERRRMEDGLIQAYPDTVNAARILFRRAKAAWNARNFAQAAAYWQRIAAPGAGTLAEARSLYWLGMAQTAMGQTQQAQQTHDIMLRRQPISYYTFLARPGATAQKLQNNTPEILVWSPSLLEDWGFVFNARVRLQRPNASGREILRSIELSQWFGEEESLYRRSLTLARYFTSGGTLYRRGLELMYPRPFRQQVEEAAAEFGIESNLVWAVMRQESAFEPRARSHAGASGLMQMMPATAQEEARRIRLQPFDVFDITDNIRMGTSYLARLVRHFGRPDWALAAYNAGQGNVNRRWLADGGRDLNPVNWIERITFPETSEYLQRVGANIEIYRMLYGTP